MSDQPASREAAAAYDAVGEVTSPEPTEGITGALQREGLVVGVPREAAEPTSADIAANRLKLQELRDSVDRLTTPKTIVLSGYTVLGLAQASMVERNQKAMEEWQARHDAAEVADELLIFDEEPPTDMPLELQDLGAGVEARLKEALHEVVKASTMQAAADKGARAGLEKLMGQLMTDMDVLGTQVRGAHMKLDALHSVVHKLDADALMLAELAVVAALDVAGELTPPADNDADLGQAIDDTVFGPR